MNRASSFFPYPAIAIVTLLILTACRMGHSTYMTEEQQQQFETAYDSLENTYDALMKRYESVPDSLPADLHTLYTRMQGMYRQMDANHRQMMSMHMGRHGDMMGTGMQMGMHRQGHMTGEWYQQMMSMHDRMASVHRNTGEQEMAEMNRQLSRGFGRMMQMIPNDDAETDELADNGQADPSTLNGESLYSRNCASCHGSNGEGLAGVFPPLVDSKWITGEQSVPIRILLNGLSGEIEVGGKTYRGSMPAFRARLNSAEMAAILNHLRSLSKQGLSEITREDVAAVRESYSGRTSPWQAEELAEE